MAYMNQEKKKALAPKINEVLKKYGMKGTIGVHHYSTLVVNVNSGSLDIITNYNNRAEERNLVSAKDQCMAVDYLSVNPYYIHESYTGEVKDFLTELKDACMQGNHNNSDVMTDYFDVGWYIDINVGRWDKPYVYTGR